MPGSNRRPPACKAGALPTELTPRVSPILAASGDELELLPGVTRIDSRRARGTSRRLRIGACAERRRLVRRERPGRGVVDVPDVRLGMCVREPRCVVLGVRHQRQRPGARLGELPLPLGIAAGGVPRAVRRVQAPRGRRGAPASCVGLRPLPSRHGARLRRRRRGSVRRPHGRGSIGGREAPLPRVGAGGGLRRERGGGDGGREAGVRALRAAGSVRGRRTGISFPGRRRSSAPSVSPGASASLPARAS